MRVLPIRTALLSVYDKSGIVELARTLERAGVALLSTGGTAAALSEAGIAHRSVEAVAGQAEILGGRVKTLHPVIHAGILARRDVPGDMELLARDGITPIDLVVVNLYPFEDTIATDPDDLAAAIEKIDIGGPTMIRSSAKNHRDVTVVTDPADYADLTAELSAHGGHGVSEDFARLMAVKAFQLTASYDAAISAHFAPRYGSERFPARFAVGGPRLQTLRYGENPHQAAAFYRLGRPLGLAAAQIVQGKELSYNNLLDLDGALRAVVEFTDEPAAVVVKHTNPCGVAIADSLVEAYTTARAVDPVSAFGGILAFNRPIDAATATEIASTFVECVVCPGIAADAAEILAAKKNMRVVVLDPWPTGPQALPELRVVTGGLLVQDPDIDDVPERDWKVVTKRAPSDAERRAMRFAWKVVKHVKSNAIVFASERATLGIGAGQMSRVDSSRIAVWKAQSPLAGSALASDAFFPFRDGIDAAAEAGARAVIQPGGSMRDAEVIAAADEHGMTMVFTGTRHFKH